MATENEASCQSCASDPNFAVICSFLERFAEQCGIPHPTFLELQEMIENTQQVPQALIDLHVKLLRKARKTFSVEKWERTLVRFCHSYNMEEGWELEKHGYKNADVSIRLRLLKLLLDAQFDLNTKFKTDINKLNSCELRGEPLGRDKLGHNYWCQLDPTANVRVYKEDQEDETWELVAKDREGLVTLITDLSVGENIPGLDDLLNPNEDSNSQDIDKPVLDTGQGNKTENGHVSDKSERSSSSSNSSTGSSDSENEEAVVNGDSKNSCEKRQESGTVSCKISDKLENKDIAVKSEVKPNIEDKSSAKTEIVGSKVDVKYNDEDKHAKSSVKSEVVGSNDNVKDNTEDKQANISLKDVKNETHAVTDLSSEKKSNDLNNISTGVTSMEVVHKESRTPSSEKITPVPVPKSEDISSPCIKSKEIVSKRDDSDESISLSQTDVSTIAASELCTEQVVSKSKPDTVMKQLKDVDKTVAKVESCTVEQILQKQDNTTELKSTVKIQVNKKEKIGSIKEKPDDLQNIPLEKQRIEENCDLMKSVQEEGIAKVENRDLIIEDLSHENQEKGKSIIAKSDRVKEPCMEKKTGDYSIVKCKKEQSKVEEQTDSCRKVDTAKEQNIKLTNDTKISPNIGTKADINPSLDKSVKTNIDDDINSEVVKDSGNTKLKTETGKDDSNQKPVLNLSKDMGESSVKDFAQNPTKTILQRQIPQNMKCVDLSSKKTERNVVDVTEEIKQRGALLKSSPGVFRGKGDGKSAPGSKLDEIFKLKRNLGSMTNATPESQPLPAHFVGTSKSQLLEKMRMNVNESLNLSGFSDSGKYTQPSNQHVKPQSRDVEDLSMNNLKRSGPEDLSVHPSKKPHLDEKTAEPEVSEAIEEPVMLIKGEGSGKECDTGNPGKEHEKVESNMKRDDSLTVDKSKSAGETTSGNIAKDDTPSEKNENNSSGGAPVTNCLLNANKDSTLKSETSCVAQQAAEKKVPKLWSIDAICSPDKSTSTSKEVTVGICTLKSSDATSPDTRKNDLLKDTSKSKTKECSENRNDENPSENLSGNNMSKDCEDSEQKLVSKEIEDQKIDSKNKSSKSKEETIVSNKLITQSGEEACNKDANVGKYAEETTISSPSKGFFFGPGCVKMDTAMDLKTKQISDKVKNMDSDKKVVNPVSKSTCDKIARRKSLNSDKNELDLDGTPSEPKKTKVFENEDVSKVKLDNKSSNVQNKIIDSSVKNSKGDSTNSELSKFKSDKSNKLEECYVNNVCKTESINRKSNVTKENSKDSKPSSKSVHGIEKGKTGLVETNVAVNPLSTKKDMPSSLVEKTPKNVSSHSVTVVTSASKNVTDFQNVKKDSSHSITNVTDENINDLQKDDQCESKQVSRSEKGDITINVDNKSDETNKGLKSVNSKTISANLESQKKEGASPSVSKTEKQIVLEKELSPNEKVKSIIISAHLKSQTKEGENLTGSCTEKQTVSEKELSPNEKVKSTTTSANSKSQIKEGGNPTQSYAKKQTGLEKELSSTEKVKSTTTSANSKSLSKERESPTESYAEKQTVLEKELPPNEKIKSSTSSVNSKSQIKERESPTASYAEIQTVLEKELSPNEKVKSKTTSANSNTQIKEGERPTSSYAEKQTVLEKKLAPNEKVKSTITSTNLKSQTKEEESPPASFTEKQTVLKKEMDPNEKIKSKTTSANSKSQTKEEESPTPSYTEKQTVLKKESSPNEKVKSTTPSANSKSQTKEGESPPASYTEKQTVVEKASSTIEKVKSTITSSNSKSETKKGESPTPSNAEKRTVLKKELSPNEKLKSINISANSKSETKKGESPTASYTENQTVIEKVLSPIEKAKSTTTSANSNSQLKGESPTPSHAEKQTGLGKELPPNQKVAETLCSKKGDQVEMKSDKSKATEEKCDKVNTQTTQDIVDKDPQMHKANSKDGESTSKENIALFDKKETDKNLSPKKSNTVSNSGNKESNLSTSKKEMPSQKCIMNSKEQLSDSIKKTKSSNKLSTQNNTNEDKNIPADESKIKCNSSDFEISPKDSLVRSKESKDGTKLEDKVVSSNLKKVDVILENEVGIQNVEKNLNDKGKQSTSENNKIDETKEEQLSKLGGKSSGIKNSEGEDNKPESRKSSKETVVQPRTTRATRSSEIKSGNLNTDEKDKLAGKVIIKNISDILKGDSGSSKDKAQELVVKEDIKEKNALKKISLKPLSKILKPEIIAAQTVNEKSAEKVMKRDSFSVSGSMLNVDTMQDIKPSTTDLNHFVLSVDEVPSKLRKTDNLVLETEKHIQNVRKALKEREKKVASGVYKPEDFVILHPPPPVKEPSHEQLRQSETLVIETELHIQNVRKALKEKEKHETSIIEPDTELVECTIVEPPRATQRTSTRSRGKNVAVRGGRGGSRGRGSRGGGGSRRNSVSIVVDDEIEIIPDKDPLAISEEDILALQKGNKDTKEKDAGFNFSISTFSLDVPEDIPEKQSENKNKAKGVLANVEEISLPENRKRRSSRRLGGSKETDDDWDPADKVPKDEDDGTGGKRRKLKGKRAPNTVVRRSVENKRGRKSSTSEDEGPTPATFEGAFANFVSKKEKKSQVKDETKPGRGGAAKRGRSNRGIKKEVKEENDVEEVEVEDEDGEEDDTKKGEEKSEDGPPKEKQPKKKAVRASRLEIELGIKLESVGEGVGNDDSNEAASSRSVRASRRIAQIKIREAAEQREIEEATLLSLKDQRSNKKKEKNMDKSFKSSAVKLGDILKKTKSKQAKPADTSSVNSVEIVLETPKKSKKKKKHHAPTRAFDGRNPWASTSDSSSSNEEEEEHFDIEEEEEEEELVLKSDHEFSPESDVDDEEFLPLRRARTAQKGEGVKGVEIEDGGDEYACQKCNKVDNPEWILLCDKCDQGWHAACLQPPIMVIPEGDWFCPKCQHLTLIHRLHETLKNYDKETKRRTNEELRRKRLAYVGISLDNVLSQEKKEKAKEKSVVSSSSSAEGSSSESESDEEPVYQLRQRRQTLFSYRFNEYDDLINSAIQDELDAAGVKKVKGIVPLVPPPPLAADDAVMDEQSLKAEGDAKVNTEKQEKKEDLSEEREKEVDQEDGEDDKGDDEEDDDEDYEGEEEIPRVVPKGNNALPGGGRKKHRKPLNALDVSSDDNDDDEDFKGSSDDEEEEDADDLDSDDSTVGRRFGRPVRRSSRTRVSRFDKEFINDDSESEDSEGPKRKKTRRVWQESDSEESDSTWGRRKKKKSSSYSTPKPRRSKKKKKKKKGRRTQRIHNSDEETAKVPKRKKPKIKYGLDEPEDNLPSRRTRGRKINYQEVVGSDTEEEIFNPNPSKKIISDDEEDFNIDAEKEAGGKKSDSESGAEEEEEDDGEEGEESEEESEEEEGEEEEKKNSEKVKRKVARVISDDEDEEENNEEGGDGSSEEEEDDDDDDEDDDNDEEEEDDERENKEDEDSMAENATDKPVSENISRGKHSKIKSDTKVPIKESSTANGSSKVQPPVDNKTIPENQGKSDSVSVEDKRKDLLSRFSTSTSSAVKSGLAGTPPLKIRVSKGGLACIKQDFIPGTNQDSASAVQPLQKQLPPQSATSAVTRPLSVGASLVERAAPAIVAKQNPSTVSVDLRQKLQLALVKKMKKAQDSSLRGQLSEENSDEEPEDEEDLLDEEEEEEEEEEMDEEEDEDEETLEEGEIPKSMLMQAAQKMMNVNKSDNKIGNHLKGKKGPDGTGLIAQPDNSQPGSIRLVSPLKLMANPPPQIDCPPQFPRLQPGLQPQSMLQPVVSKGVIDAGVGIMPEDSPPKRKGRGRGKKQLAQEKAAQEQMAAERLSKAQPPVQIPPVPPSGGSVIRGMLQTAQPLGFPSPSRHFSPNQVPPRGEAPGRGGVPFPAMARGRIPFPVHQYPGNQPHRLNRPPQPQLYHSSHHPLDPSPSGGGPINIPPPTQSKGDTVPPVVPQNVHSTQGKNTPPQQQPAYHRPQGPSTANLRFPLPDNNSSRHSLPFMSSSPNPTRMPGNYQQPYHHPPPPPPPPPPSNYHYPAPAPAAGYPGSSSSSSMAIGGEDAMPPAAYQQASQGSPYGEHYSETNVMTSDTSNSKSYDEDGSGGEFGGLVSYFSSQREDDGLDT